MNLKKLCSKFEVYFFKKELSVRFVSLGAVPNISTKFISHFDYFFQDHLTFSNRVNDFFFLFFSIYKQMLSFVLFQWSKKLYIKKKKKKKKRVSRILLWLKITKEHQIVKMFFTPGQKLVILITVPWKVKEPKCFLWWNHCKTTLLKTLFLRV